jgi:hypothetical protein
MAHLRHRTLENIERARISHAIQAWGESIGISFPINFQLAALAKSLSSPASFFLAFFLFPFFYSRIIASVTINFQRRFVCSTLTYDKSNCRNFRAGSSRSSGNRFSASTADAKAPLGQRSTG